MTDTVLAAKSSTADSGFLANLTAVQRTERGMWPARPKLGYLRDHATMQLIPDPERWDIVKEMWLKRAAGESMANILLWATDNMDLRLPPNRTRGRGRLPLSRLYLLFQDPFYAGLIQHKQGCAPGQHLPMISWDTFQAVQSRAPGSRPWSRPVEERAVFTYRGLLRCGHCPSMITAQVNVNRHGTRYKYYRCARRVRQVRFCPALAVQEEEIEAQFLEFFHSVALPRTLVDWAIEVLENDAGREKLDERQAKLRSDISELDRKLARARMLCIDGVLPADEFEHVHLQLVSERAATHARLEAMQTAESVLQPWKTMGSWLTDAENEFRSANAERKRQIIETVCYNPILKDKKVDIKANEIAAKLAAIKEIPDWSGQRESDPSLLLGRQP